VGAWESWGERRQRGAGGTQSEGLSQSYRERSGGAGGMVGHPRGVKLDPKAMVDAET